MPWTDQQAIRVIQYFRDKFDIKTFVETGTFMGINAKLHSNNFKEVLTCEKVDEYYKKAKERLKDCKNVICIHEHSPKFLHRFSDGDAKIYYLDAHFYDENVPQDKRFVVLEELDAIGPNKKSIIIVHDFDNGLGHITYDGISLDMDLLRSRLKKINSEFYFYTNDLASCDPVAPTVHDIENAGLEVDKETLDNIEFAWTFPRLTYRGILYCLPKKLSDEELTKLGLRKWN